MSYQTDDASAVAGWIVIGTVVAVAVAVLGAVARRVKLVRRVA